MAGRRCLRNGLRKAKGSYSGEKGRATSTKRVQRMASGLIAAREPSCHEEVVVVDGEEAFSEEDRQATENRTFVALG